MRRVGTSAAAAIVLLLATGAGFAQEEQPAFKEALTEAYRLLGNKDYEGAVKAFRKAHRLEEAPSFKCAIGRGTAYNWIGAFKDAEKSAREAMELATTPKERSEAHAQTGVALFAQGTAGEKDLRAAEQELRKALEIRGDAMNDARFPLGFILLKLERDDEGVAVLEQYLAGEPGGRSAREARAFVEDPRRARVPIVPDFEIVTLEGESLTPEDLEGKVVLFDFWGTWCGPCVAAIPHLRRLSRKSEKNPFVIVGIAADNDEDELRDFVSEHEMAWPQYLDARRDVADEIFDVRSFPTYVLVDHEGVMMYRTSGWSDRIGLEINRQVGKAIRAAKKSVGE